MVINPEQMSFQAMWEFYWPAQTVEDAWDLWMRGCYKPVAYDRAQWEKEGWRAMWLKWLCDGEGRVVICVRTSEEQMAARAAFQPTEKQA